MDRTNYFQAKLALLTLESILERFSITFDQPLIEQMNDPDNHTQLITQFRNTWADNGDAISFHYTGTGSTPTVETIDSVRGGGSPLCDLGVTELDDLDSIATSNYVGVANHPCNAGDL